MKGYKIFNNNWTCNGHQFEIGKEYVHEGPLEICKSGFHFCVDLKDCFKYYKSVQWNKIAEVEARGKTVTHNDDSKVCTDRIFIVQEVAFDDAMAIIEAQIKEKGESSEEASVVASSRGVAYSTGVADSRGVASSTGVAYSTGVADSRGVADSTGVAYSRGVASSRGVAYSTGVASSMFVSGVHRDPLLFNKPTNGNRISTVRSEFDRLLGGWEPTFNNLKSLWIKAGEKWECTPIPNAKTIQKEEAWADCPKKAIEYLKTLPEFDAAVFEAVTGIKA